MLFSVRVQTCFTYSSHIWSMWYHLNICWLRSGLCQWSRHWWPVVFICISEEKRKRNLFFYLLKCIGLTHCIKHVLTSIPYKWLKKRHVICFKYLLTAKLTVPMKLNLTTGHFFCIPWNKFVSLVRVHWLDSHQTCFNIWFPYMVYVILFKYLLIVKLIVSRKKVHCFDMSHHICLVKQFLYTI